MTPETPRREVEHSTPLDGYTIEDLRGNPELAGAVFGRPVLNGVLGLPDIHTGVGEYGSRSMLEIK